MATRAKTVQKKVTKKVAKKATAKKAPGKKAPGKKAPSKKAAAKKATAKKAAAKSPVAKKVARKKLKFSTPVAPKPDVNALDPDALEFIDAIDKYKHAHQRPFPTWSEILHILRCLGYTKKPKV